MIVGFVLASMVVIAVSVVMFQRLYRFRSRGPEHVIPYLRAGGSEELDSLVDSRQELYLFLNLEKTEFRKAQINRIHLTREKLRRRGHNAVIFQEWADYELDRSLHTLDQQTGATAEKLFNLCAQFRMAAFWIEGQLTLWQIKLLLLPRAQAPQISRLRKIDSFDLLETYQQIRHTAAELAVAYGGDYRERLQNAL
jgi:hypothetical protein